MVEFKRDWLGLSSMQREMERLLDHISSAKPPRVHWSPGRWQPSLDVYETDDQVVVLVELAGVKREGIEIIVDRDTFVIRGERPDIRPCSGGSCYQMEIATGPFERGIVLPAAVDLDQTQASYQDGMVEVKLTKAKEGRTLKVRIKTGEEEAP